MQIFHALQSRSLQLKNLMHLFLVSFQETFPNLAEVSIEAKANRPKAFLQYAA